MNVHPDIIQKYSNLRLEEIQMILEMIEDFGTSALTVNEEILQCFTASVSKHETEARSRVWQCDQTLQRISNISYSLKAPQSEG